METSLYDLVYLISIVLFIVGLKRLSSPDTARNGNLIAAAGMGIAIIVSIFYPLEGGGNNYGWVAGGMLVGGVIGYTAARRVKMTAMPEMVSLFNGRVTSSHSQVKVAQQQRYVHCLMRYRMLSGCSSD